MSPKGRQMSTPSTMGTATPAHAMSVAARPVWRSAFMSVSRPVENMRKSTPILEKISRPSVPIENASPSTVPLSRKRGV